MLHVTLQQTYHRDFNLPLHTHPSNHLPHPPNATSPLPDFHKACINGPSNSTLPYANNTDHMPNSMFSPKPWPPLKQRKQTVVILVIAYMAVAVVGFISNLLVVMVIFCLPSMRSVTNLFLANLALADILVCILVLPMTLLDNIYTEWEFGPVVCKLFPYLQGISINGSVNTLGVVAIERYLAVFYSNNFKMKQKSAFLAIALIWIVPMFLFIPWIVVYEEKVYDVSGASYVACQANWSNVILNQFYTLAVVFLACYLLPLVCIGIFYICIGIKVSKRMVPGTNGSKAGQNIARSKRRILSMLIVVSCFFAISWLPFYSINVFILFSKSIDKSTKVLLKDYVKPFAQWLAASNSCVNPFIYCYFNAYFRRSIIDLVNRTKGFVMGRDHREMNLKVRRQTNDKMRE